MRLQLVITVESVSEVHRPRWEDHPIRPRQRQLHIGFDGADGHQVHLILASGAATGLFALLHPLLTDELGDT